MKLSIFYHHLRAWAQQKNISLDTALETARSLGITHVEADCDDIADPQQFAALLSAHDLRVSSIYGFYDWTNRPDDDRNDLQLHQASMLHCDKIMVIPGFYTKEIFSTTLHDPSSSLSEADASLRSKEDSLLQAGMRRMLQKASALGLTVTIEDFDLNTSPICSSRGMLTMEQNARGLRTTFDTGNFYYSGEDALKAMDALQGTISHVHLKDRLLLSHLSESLLPQDPEKTYGHPAKTTAGEDMYPCAVGTGSMPILQVLDILHAQGYDGCCAMEFFGAADYEQAARDSVAFLMKTGYFPAV